MLVGPVEAGVNRHDLALALRPRRGICIGVGHGPFEFGVRGAQLVLVGAVIAPQAVCGRCIEDFLSDAQRRSQREHFGFDQIRNGTHVDAAVTVFGVKAHAEVLHLVARAGDQCAALSGQGVQRRHPQARP